MTLVAPTSFGRSSTDTVASLADRLLDLGDTDHPTPLLVLFRDDTGTIEPLDDADAVRSLRGRIAPSDVDAIGFVAPAHITSVAPLDGSATDGARADGTRSDGTVAHVLGRDGTSATAVRTGSMRRVIGTSTTPQSGRVPDSCRRLLSLATAPPDRPMLDFVVAAWLEVITRRALVDPSLEWDDAIALHPAASSIPTPATVTEVARATVELGLSLDWERFRRVIAMIGGVPFGDDAEATAEWMDAGMFSRWALDEVADPATLLEMLDATLAPSIAERLWATVRLTQADDAD